MGVCRISQEWVPPSLEISMRMMTDDDWVVEMAAECMVRLVKLVMKLVELMMTFVKLVCRLVWLECYCLVMMMTVLVWWMRVGQ